METSHYEPIADWSREARAHLVAQRGDEVRTLLRIAFMNFYEQGDLAPFGFRGEDPVEEAVEWSVSRFAAGDLDPRRCTTTFQIFTEARFWLTQKVGVKAYNRLRRIHARAETAEPALGSNEAGDELRRSTEVLDEMRERLARTLQQLAHCTCSDLVAYWLDGTHPLRAAWFGWTASLDLENASSSKKKRSFYVHDALFRYQCLHQQLVSETDSSVPTVAVRESMFRRCENRPPYRRPDASMAHLLPAASVTGPRSVSMLRHNGLAALLARLLSLLEHGARDEQDALERVFLRKSLSATTVHALDLERRDDLLTRVRALPSAESLISEEP